MTPTAAQQAEIAADLAALHEKPHSSGDFVPVHPAVAGLIAGHEVLPHVQRYADELRRATRVQSIGTYPGHSPSIDRALDQFHRVGDDALANDICDFFLANWKRYGGRYIMSRWYICHRLDPVWRWMEDRGDNTQNHYDHAHSSFELTAAEPEPTPAPVPEPTPQPAPQPQEEDDDTMRLIGVDHDRGIFLVSSSILATGKAKGKATARYVGTPQEVEALVAAGVVPGYNKSPDLHEAIFDRLFVVVEP